MLHLSHETALSSPQTALPIAVFLDIDAFCASLRALDPEILIRFQTEPERLLAALDGDPFDDNQRQPTRIVARRAYGRGDTVLNAGLAQAGFRQVISGDLFGSSNQNLVMALDVLAAALQTKEATNFLILAPGQDLGPLAAQLSETSHTLTLYDNTELSPLERNLVSHRLTERHFISVLTAAQPDLTLARAASDPSDMRKTERARIGDGITSAVKKALAEAKSPIKLDILTRGVVDRVGEKLIEKSRWAGYGSMEALLAARLREPLGVSQTLPVSVYDSTRHAKPMAVDPSQVPVIKGLTELAQRLLRAANVPALSPHAYKGLFEVMALVLNGPRADFSETIEATSLRCEDYGISCSPDQVAFVLRRLMVTEYPVQQLAHTSEKLAAHYRRAIQSLADSLNIELSSDERITLTTWLGLAIDTDFGSSETEAAREGTPSNANGPDSRPRHGQIKPASASGPSLVQSTSHPSASYPAAAMPLTRVASGAAVAVHGGSAAALRIDDDAAVHADEAIPARELRTVDRPADEALIRAPGTQAPGIQAAGIKASGIKASGARNHGASVGTVQSLVTPLTIAQAQAAQADMASDGADLQPSAQTLPDVSDWSRVETTSPTLPEALKRPPSRPTISVGPPVVSDHPGFHVDEAAFIAPPQSAGSGDELTIASHAPVADAPGAQEQGQEEGLETGDISFASSGAAPEANSPAANTAEANTEAARIAAELVAEAATPRSVEAAEQIQEAGRQFEPLVPPAPPKGSPTRLLSSLASRDTSRMRRRPSVVSPTEGAEQIEAVPSGLVSGSNSGSNSQTAPISPEPTERASAAFERLRALQALRSEASSASHLEPDAVTGARTGASFSGSHAVTNSGSNRGQSSECGDIERDPGMDDSWERIEEILRILQVPDQKS